MKTHNTIENVVALAEAISKKYAVTMDQAVELAEFNLNYSQDYKEALARV